MKGIRRKLNGFILILCFFIVAGAFMSLTQGTKNAYGAEEAIQIILKFDTVTGNILDVQPVAVGEKKPAFDVDYLAGRGEPIPLTKILIHKPSDSWHDYMKIHWFVFEWGSPGSIIVPTANGPKRISWPQ